MTTAASPTSTAADTAAQARIQRLRAAIGDGPHAFGFKPNLHLRSILVTLKDEAAVALFDAQNPRR